MPASTHLTRIPVRWADMDAFGHVNNAVYSTYFEQARVEWLEAALGTSIVDDAAAGPVLVAIEKVFKRPIVAPATALVEARAGAPGRTSFGLDYTLRLEGDGETVYAEARSTIVWVDRATGRPTPLPDPLRQLLQAASEG